MSGGPEPVIDPTKNVLDTLNAAVKRLDDLFTAHQHFTSNEAGHLKDLMELRAAHTKEMRELESSRLNAIRQVDVTAVKTEADRALAAIQTLAATTASNAENLRNALNTTASTIAAQTAGTVSAMTERIAALEKSSYTGAGKEAVADPATRLLIEEVRALRERQQITTGKGEGVSAVWLVVSGAVGFLATILSISSLVYTLTRPAEIIVPNPAPTRQELVK